MPSPLDFLDMLFAGMFPFGSSMRSLYAAPNAHADAPGEASFGRATTCAEIFLQRGGGGYGRVLVPSVKLHLASGATIGPLEPPPRHADDWRT